MNTTLILQNVYFLRGALNPDWFDGHPGQPGPPIGPAISDYIVAGLLRDISLQLNNRELATTIHAIGKELASTSARSLAEDWDDKHLSFDFWLHIWRPDPWPEPWPIDPLSRIAHLLKTIAPRPEPWLSHTTPAMNDIVLAHALRELASLTSSEKASNAIKAAGEGIVKFASTRLFDEYCATVVHHNLPAPKHKVPAA